MMSRSGIVIGVGAALVTAAVVLGAVVGVRSLERLAGERSTARCDFGRYSLSTDQAQVAATIVGETSRLGVPEPADVLVLMAALQESSLANIPAGQGDRDSVGVLQQRPSQGWGSAEQLGEIDFATQAFLDALIKVPGWQTMAPAAAIQTVQISADGSAYAQHEGMARALADALQRSRAGRHPLPVQPPDDDGVHGSDRGRSAGRSGRTGTGRDRSQGHGARGALADGGLAGREQRRPRDRAGRVRRSELAARTAVDRRSRRGRDRGGRDRHLRRVSYRFSRRSNCRWNGG